MLQLFLQLAKHFRSKEMLICDDEYVNENVMKMRICQLYITQE